MTTFAVIGFLATQASGAAGTSMSSADSRAQGLAARVFAPDLISGVASSVPAVDSGPNPAAAPECPSARQAVRFYGVRVDYWRTKMGATAKDLGHAQTGKTCPRYLSKLLRAKAYALRHVYERWHAYHYDWSSWLPDKWQRIGACETGYGRRPGNWRHSNSSYEGAFGFAKSSWDSFKYRADRKAGPYPEDAWQATPRQQYEVALAIYRAYGFSGWGCRGA